MTRKETIQAQAREHASRGIYDSAVCRTGFERIIYSDSWHEKMTGKIHPDLEISE